MNKFDQLYKKYEDLVSDGTFDGDARDKVDTILQIIYDTDDLPSGIYESLKTLLILVMRWWKILCVIQMKITKQFLSK